MIYYNEWDPFAAAWLCALISEGLIPAGDVDTRSIRDVAPADLQGYTQCHFFAGIGGWSLALALAGWPATRPVWTGSCPCQPFSTAGKGKGETDERHLWPEFKRLIAECGPPSVFGEQVASRAGRAWLAGVRADLEALGYAVGAADLCAAGVGAPHIRQRLYWMADADDRGRCAGHGETGGAGKEMGIRPGAVSRDSGTLGGVADSISQRGCGGDGQGEHATNALTSGAVDWLRSQWILCRDGKQRRIPLESGLFPLAHGVPNRVGLLRGAGNAIVPELAATFIRAAVG